MFEIYLDFCVIEYQAVEILNIQIKGTFAEVEYITWFSQNGNRTFLIPFSHRFDENVFKHLQLSVILITSRKTCTKFSYVFHRKVSEKQQQDKSAQEDDGNINPFQLQGDYKLMGLSYNKEGNFRGVVSKINGFSVGINF